MSTNFNRTVLFLTIVISCTAQMNSVLAANITPHTAIYDLKLIDASKRSGITSIDGRMVYEIVGSKCSGYTVNFRMLRKISNNETQRYADSFVKTFEDLSTNYFSFSSESLIDMQKDNETMGEAVRGPKGLDIMLAGADEKITADHALYPTEHLIELLAKANAGETLFEAKLFDGSGEGKEPVLTTSLIGKQRKNTDVALIKSVREATKNTKFWPVTISYYENAGDGDQLPIYRFKSMLHENGIWRSLIMDFGEFSLAGTLSDIVLQPIDDCSN